jgi:oligopeptide/dipeptide ABC transporter ATP-binding protein
MTPLLEVDNLHIEYSTHGQKLYAVSGVNFTLQKGEILGIVGESGCGKSATAKAISRLLPKHNSRYSGRVLYEGKNLLSLNEKEMQRIRGKEIGMIFQDPMTSLNPTSRIGTQIIEGYKKHHPLVSPQEALDYAVELLELVGIPQASTRINEYPHTLSGGMRQRVMMALALACKPKILIADEPTTALDVTIQAQILSLIKDIQKKTDTSIILITHDLSVIAGFCDRVLVMYAGKVVESGSVDNLFYQPQHPYTQKLLQALPKINRPPGEPLLSIEGQPPQLKKQPSSCCFAPRCPYAMKICTQKLAPLHIDANGHEVRCWLKVKRDMS